jgi:hypothetical protein
MSARVCGVVPLYVVSSKVFKVVIREQLSGHPPDVGAGWKWVYTQGYNPSTPAKRASKWMADEPGRMATDNGRFPSAGPQVETPLGS